MALAARVIELSAEERGDVLRITCTVMGRVVGGAGARSRISYGGAPEKREELEKEVLTQVANGLVARLAQIVRTQAPQGALRSDKPAAVRQAASTGRVSLPHRRSTARPPTIELDAPPWHLL